MAYPTLSSSELAHYDSRGSQARLKRDTDTAANQYARFVSQQRWNRDRDDAGQAYGQARNRFATPYLRRGVQNSGIYKQGLTNFVADRAKQESRFNQDYTASIGQYDQNDAEYATAYQQQLADIEMEKQARIRDIAAQLAAAKPYV